MKKPDLENSLVTLEIVISPSQLHNPTHTSQNVYESFTLRDWEEDGGDTEAFENAATEWLFKASELAEEVQHWETGCTPEEFRARIVELRPSPRAPPPGHERRWAVKRSLAVRLLAVRLLAYAVACPHSLPLLAGALDRPRAR